MTLVFRFLTRARRCVSVLALLPVAVSADVYKCLDQKAKVFYQDRPCRELTPARLPPGLSRLAPSDNRPHFLWKAVSAKGTVYLMGALPYGASDMYPLPESITDALAESDVLIVGADVQALPQAELLSIAANLGVYSDHSGLRDHIKAAAWERVLKLSKALGIAEETLLTWKPWMASLSLMNLAAKQAGYTQEFGIDKAFVKDAQMQKPVLQLDSAEEQVKMLDGLSGLEQEQFLLKSLDEIEDGYFKSMIEAWTNGDASSIELMVRRRFDSFPAAHKLFTDRSAAMAEKIGTLAADGRTYFAVLEAGRLVGEHGLLHLMESKGFKISQR